MISNSRTRPRLRRIGTIVVGVLGAVGLTMAVGAPAQAADRCQGIIVDPNGGLPRGTSFSDGTLTLAHQGDGNVVVYEDGRAEWATGTNDRDTTVWVHQPDANVVLYNGSSVVWASDTDNQRDGLKLIIAGAGCGATGGEVRVGLGTADGNTTVIFTELSRWYL